LALCLVTTTYSDESDNLIVKEAWQLEGDVKIEERGWSGGTQHNIRFGTEGGTATQQLDFSAYEQIDAINYSMMAIGCNNSPEILDCTGITYDQLIVTLNYGEEQFIHNISLDNNDGFTLHEAVSVPTGYSTTGSVSIWGRDAGAWAGWYGPVTEAHSLSVTYSIPEYDVVLDDPNFLNNMTGVHDNIMDVAMHHEPMPQHHEHQQMDMLSVDVKLELPPIQHQEMQQQKIEMVEMQQGPPLLAEVKQAEPQQERDEPIHKSQAAEEPAQKQEQQEPSEPEQREEPKKQEQQQERKNVRLDTIMANVTIGGVPASELGQVDAYNQVAQAVAMSLLTATRIEDTYIADAPFYNQEQLEDATLDDSYTGYVAINRSRMNQLVDMQWQRQK
tara:strand:- start:643 stop:1806 length:1164 start_codon:yes stop_codon:yes gene_type:complete